MGYAHGLLMRAEMTGLINSVWAYFESEVVRIAAGFVFTLVSGWISSFFWSFTPVLNTFGSSRRVFAASSHQRQLPPPAALVCRPRRRVRVRPQRFFSAKLYHWHLFHAFSDTFASPMASGNQMRRLDKSLDLTYDATRPYTGAHCCWFLCTGI
jgi:hypothetical protein